MQQCANKLLNAAIDIATEKLSYLSAMVKKDELEINLLRGENTTIRKTADTFQAELARMTEARDVSNKTAQMLYRELQEMTNIAQRLGDLHRHWSAVDESASINDVRKIWPEYKETEGKHE